MDLVVFVSTSDSFIVHLCAGHQRLEGLSASELPEWTSLCNIFICVDPAPRVSPAVLCVNIGLENGIFISPLLDFTLLSPEELIHTGLSTLVCQTGSLSLHPSSFLSLTWVWWFFSCLLCPISKYYLYSYWCGDLDPKYFGKIILLPVFGIEWEQSFQLCC